MPEICRFYGIVIKMYFADHAPPHFHAENSAVALHLFPPVKSVTLMVKLAGFSPAFSDRIILA